MIMRSKRKATDRGGCRLFCEALGGHRFKLIERRQGKATETRQPASEQSRETYRAPSFQRDRNPTTGNPTTRLPLSPFFSQGDIHQSPEKGDTKSFSLRAVAFLPGGMFLIPKQPTRRPS